MKQAQRLALEDSLKPFDLTQDLMLRASLLTLQQPRDNQPQHILLFNIHHIASDGWSLNILSREFMQLYQAFDTKTESKTAAKSPLPALAIQYADFAHWQQNQLNAAALKPLIHYWSQQLSDIPQVA